jgi:type IV secretory pathway VirB10-like protein
MASRVKQLNISVLEEVSQQPDGTCAFTCLGPDDHIIQIATELIQPVPVQPVTESPSPLTTPQAAAPQPPTPVQTPVVPPGQPTRADRYWLEAQDRLAKIKEELASLSTSFSQTDIAGTLDEMKQKVAQRVAEVAEKVVTPTDQEAERERKRREAEEALARYKQVVAQEHQQEPAKPTKLEEEGLKPVRKTLGPASDDKPPRE